jgi:hypothetical protein
LNDPKFLSQGIPPLLEINRRANSLNLALGFKRLRSSFIEYHFAANRNHFLTAQVAGIQPQFYAKALRQTVPDAENYWSLTPENCGRAKWNEISTAES